MYFNKDTYEYNTFSAAACFPFNEKSSLFQSQPLTLLTPQESGKLPKVKEYVEWLHQNPKTTLLYGKNNVYVQPVSSKIL